MSSLSRIIKMLFFHIESELKTRAQEFERLTPTSAAMSKFV